MQLLFVEAYFYGNYKQYSDRANYFGLNDKPFYLAEKFRWPNEYIYHNTSGIKNLQEAILRNNKMIHADGQWFQSMHEHHADYTRVAEQAWERVTNYRATLVSIHIDCCFSDEVLNLLSTARAIVVPQNYSMAAAATKKIVTSKENISTPL